MSDDNDHKTKIWGAFVDVLGMQQLESYLKRGRVFENTSAEEIKERWIDLFRELANLDNTHEMERHDFEAELSLRNDEPPYDLVISEIDAFRQRVSAVSKENMRDPNRQVGAGAKRILAEFQAFMDSFNKPSN